MDYKIRIDAKHGPLELMDPGRMAAECSERWWNETLCRVNDSVVRLGVVEGEFHWHRHEKEDECFLVLDGRLFIDLEGRTIELGPRQGVLVPKGVVHRTRAPTRTVMLMIEGANVEPTGD